MSTSQRTQRVIVGNKSAYRFLTDWFHCKDETFLTTGRQGFVEKVLGQIACPCPYMSAMLQLCSLWLGLLWSSIMSIQAGDSKTPICLPKPPQYMIDKYEALQNLEKRCDSQLSAVSLLRNCDGQMTLIKSQDIDIKRRRDPVKFIYRKVHLPDNVSGFLLNIYCSFDSQNELDCNWNTADIPNGAQYSISAFLCDESEVLTSWSCTTYTSGNITGCRGEIISGETNFQLIMQVNVSLPGFQYIHIEAAIEKRCVEKMNPPKFDLIPLFKSPSGDWNLDIQWPAERRLTYMYEIKINDDPPVPIKDIQEKYSVQNIDRKRTYTVSVRVKENNCKSQEPPWSDWGIKEIPAQPKYSIVMILAIVLGLPMVLLLFLLVFFKLHRIIFPPIPKPHIRVKSLLERDDPTHVKTKPANDAEDICIEDVTEMYE